VGQFGVAPLAEQVQFPSSWPSTSGPTVFAICKALQRFWSGGSKGATYTLGPRIEGRVRELILNTNRGMFKLQRTHSPGQFPGLGAMLNILPEEFNVAEAGMRFLKVVLVDAAGFNLRNQLAHGTATFNDPGTAAVATHTALSLATLKPYETGSDPAE
jgi:hypothetical protein